jgi:hypothetical protein
VLRRTIKVYKRIRKLQNKQRSINSQTEQGIRPPISEHLDFVQELIHGILWKFWNTRRFRSLHTTHTQASQTSCRKDRRALRPSAEWVNWIKYSERLCASAVEKPIQAWTSGHREPKVPHERNMCWVDSAPPHPVTHWARSGERMHRVTKFVFVGNQSRKRRHVRIDTFKFKFKDRYIFFNYLRT